MATYRLNITLPKELEARLRDKPNKSAFIAEAVRQKLDEAEKKRREETLAKAYREASEEGASVTGDWDSTAGDGL